MNDPDEPMQIEPVESEVMPSADAPARKSPAVTIIIQSWATPIIGLVMLLVGALGGFFLRPVILSGTARPTQTAQVDSSPSSGAAATAANPNAAQVMSLVKAQTRHFAGSEDAPVTIIEFSDYQ